MLDRARQRIERASCPTCSKQKEYKATGALSSGEAPGNRKLPPTTWFDWVQSIANGWTEVFDWVGSDEDACVDFLTCWDAVRFVPGYGCLTAALDLAKKAATAYPLDLPKRRSSGYPLFIWLSACLQQLRGDVPILLPCHKLDKLLECSPQTVAQYRKWAVQDGFLSILKEHTYSVKLRCGEATEFRFERKIIPPL